MDRDVGPKTAEEFGRSICAELRVLSGTSLYADFLVPVDVTSDLGAVNTSRVEDNLIDGSALGGIGSGILDGSQTGTTHADTQDGAVYTSPQVGSDDPALTFDLGGRALVDTIRVWNAVNQTDRGYKSFDVYGSVTGAGTPTSNPGDWFKMKDAGDVTLTEGGTNFEEITLNHGGQDAQYVRVENVTLFSTSAYDAQLAELRLLGTPTNFVPLTNASGEFDDAGGATQVPGWSFTGASGDWANNGQPNWVSDSQHLEDYMRVKVLNETISQTFDGAALDKAEYTLQWMVADALYTSFADYTVELVAVDGGGGETILLSGDSLDDNSLRPSVLDSGDAANPFSTFTLTGDMIEAGIAGQDLVLRFTPLAETEKWGDYPGLALDDVRLTYQIIPEPASAMLLALAGIALASRRPRSRRK